MAYKPFLIGAVLLASSQVMAFDNSYDTQRVRALEEKVSILELQRDEQDRRYRLMVEMMDHLTSLSYRIEALENRSTATDAVGRRERLTKLMKQKGYTEQQIKNTLKQLDTP